MGLNANYQTGEGSATLPKELAEASPLLRADIIKDWIYDLQKLYDQAVDEMHRPVSNDR